MYTCTGKTFMNMKWEKRFVLLLIGCLWVSEAVCAFAFSICICIQKSEGGVGSSRVRDTDTSMMMWPVLCKKSKHCQHWAIPPTPYTIINYLSGCQLLDEHSSLLIVPLIREGLSFLGPAMLLGLSCSGFLCDLCQTSGALFFCIVCLTFDQVLEASQRLEAQKFCSSLVMLRLALVASCPFQPEIPPALLSVVCV